MSGVVAEFWDSVPASALLAWVLAGIAFCAFIYKAWPWVKRFVRLVDALAELPDYMEKIRHQVENDHDTNLRDELTQVLENTERMSQQIDSLTLWQRKHEVKSDLNVARIDALERGRDD